MTQPKNQPYSRPRAKTAFEVTCPWCYKRQTLDQWDWNYSTSFECPKCKRTYYPGPKIDVTLRMRGRKHEEPELSEPDTELELDSGKSDED